MTTQQTISEYEPTYTVMDYDTGNSLDGEASAELIAASLAEGETGAVPAYRDAQGVWQYVAPFERAHYRDRLRETVVTVYVEQD